MADLAAFAAAVGWGLHAGGVKGGSGGGVEDIGSGDALRPYCFRIFVVCWMLLACNVTRRMPFGAFARSRVRSWPGLTVSSPVRMMRPSRVTTQRRTVSGALTVNPGQD